MEHFVLVQSGQLIPLMNCEWAAEESIWCTIAFHDSPFTEPCYDCNGVLRSTYQNCYVDSYLPTIPVIPRRIGAWWYTFWKVNAIVRVYDPASFNKQGHVTCQPVPPAASLPSQSVSVSLSIPALPAPAPANVPHIPPIACYPRPPGLDCTGWHNGLILT